MGDIGTKIDKFIEIFINNRGYVKVLEGLKNTLIIAVIGLVIGVVIGTLIAMVRVIPKVVSVKDRLFGPVFEPLRDPAFFCLVSIDEFGVVCWPNGADLAPDALYKNIEKAA